MNRISISTSETMAYTMVSDCFIDEYMADANDAQLKIYLYLLRQLSRGHGTSVSLLADRFNYTEKDVLRSLKYWEKKGLLHLTCNPDNELTGIQLCPFPELPAAAPAPVVSLVTTASALKINETPEAAKPSADRFPKPEYSLEQLAAFKKRETTSQLLFIAESYLGKTLSAGDIRSLFFISEELQFSFDLMDYLLQYCVERGKKDFRYIEKVAVSWAEAGITSPEQAEAAGSRYDKSVYGVMNALGKTAAPTPKEIEYIKKWHQEYSFTSDIILEACERTVLSTDKHRFEYADKILNSWKNAGVRHKKDIAALDASFEKKKPRAVSRSSSNKFNQFQQNDYDFDALEKELLSN